MIEILAILFVLAIVVSILVRDYYMKQMLRDTTVIDKSLIRKAAEYSINASNTVSPLESLTYVTKAIEIITCMHSRYGIRETNARVELDTTMLLQTCTEQKDDITRDIARVYKNMIPDHPLNKIAALDDDSDSD